MARLLEVGHLDGDVVDVEARDAVGGPGHLLDVVGVLAQALDVLRFDLDRDREVTIDLFDPVVALGRCTNLVRGQDDRRSDEHPAVAGQTVVGSGHGSRHLTLLSAGDGVRYTKRELLSMLARKWPFSA